MLKHLSVVLTAIFIFLFFFTVQAESEEWSDLAREAAAYSKRVGIEKGVRPKPGQAGIMRLAAGMMMEEKDCSTALKLYKQSVRYKSQRDTADWLNIAKAASCDNQWDEASMALYLASQNPDNLEQQKTTLLQLAQSLEKRRSYSNNWNPAALTAYNALLEIENTAFIQQKITSLQEQQPVLELNRSFSRIKGKHPSLCVRFNERLVDDDSVYYGDYIRIVPELQSDFIVDGREICIGGAEYGTQYALTIRKGLPANEVTLQESKQLTIETGHRSPAIWFEQNAYVLPMSSQSSIGLHSVNVNKAELQLYRIYERNILSDFVRSKFRKKLDQYNLDKIRNSVGEKVWQGNTEIEAPEDVEHTSALVLPKSVIQTPGLYVLVADDGDQEFGRWQDRSSQWLVVTDVGLTTYKGDDGMTVVARSLASGLPVSGIDITLYARNNKLLSAAVTDQQGVAHFAPGLFEGEGGMEAVLLVTESPERGFTFLQLGRAPFDLSDRGVNGRPAPGPIDAYVYSDRGMYRPGETVNLVALIRDQKGGGIDGPPLTLRLLSPDGKAVLERLLPQDATGSYATALPLADSARTGDWTAALYVDVHNKPVGKVNFQVQTFVPPRLEVKVTPSGIVGFETNAALQVQADYLYGSPGSSLQVKGRMELVHDPSPFAPYKGYYFGREGARLDIPAVDLDPVETDSKGSANLLCTLPDIPFSQQPLKAVVHARVVDVDGRAVTAHASLPVRHLQKYVGIKQLFPNQHVAENSHADFEIIVLDADGEPVPAADFHYRLVEEEVDYQWFIKNGNWGYERIMNDLEMETGKLDATIATPAALSIYVAQGSYRLEIRGADSSLLASRRFVAGDQVQGTNNAPDAVKLVLEQPQYKVGETAHIRIKAPYSGEASLILAGTGVHSIQHFQLDALTHELDIPVQAEWGSGTYALVTVYRPGAGNKKDSGRAMGLVWIGVDQADKQLGVHLEVPEKTRPRQTIDIPVTIEGGTPGEAIGMTLAAVDEGVLQMTGFVSPNPQAYFFGKQQLGTEIRDLYGQLIIGPDSRPLSLRTGAGDTSRRGAAESNVRVVSLFSGIVRVSDEGGVNIPLTLPDFNGRLRLMAVAWSKTKIGSVSDDLHVSDPVVVSPSLPRFLARGDNSTIQVLLENIDGPEGEYHIQCTSSGAVRLNGKAGQQVILQHGKRKSVDFSVMAQSIGSGKIHVKVSGPEGYSYSGDFALNVRGKYLPLLTRNFSRLNPGDTLTVDSQLTQGLYPETAQVAVSISSTPNLDVPGLLAELDRYPYGCLEQLTSRAMPLLYANILAQRWQYPLDTDLAGRIAEAIDLILQKQRIDGSFGLWSDRSSPEPWLTSYAMEFLSRAREQGFAVPDYFYNKGIQWLTQLVVEAHQPNPDDLAALAYAHYVLARVGQGKPEDTRYLFDNYPAAAFTPLALAQLSGALALQGDIERARKGYAAALEHDGSKTKYWQSYGTRLRDLAGTINVMHASNPALADPAAAWEELTRLLANKQYLSTQEQAWLVMAALTLEASQPLLLEVDGKAVAQDKDFFLLQRSGQELATPTSLLNSGQTAVWVSTTLQGSPAQEPPAAAKGFSLQRRWYNDDGKPITMDMECQQGDLFVVALEGKVSAAKQYRALIVDLLPAGFEIEKTTINTDQESIFSWLAESSPTLYEDALDDRYVAAFNTEALDRDEYDTSSRTFRLTYLVRAVTPGTYTLPPSEVEDMYQPEYRARTKAGQVTIGK